MGRAPAEHGPTMKDQNLSSPGRQPGVNAAIDSSKPLQGRKTDRNKIARMKLIGCRLLESTNMFATRCT